MKALILAAGYGTRLYSLTKDKAKPFLPVAGKPIVEYILENLYPIEGLDEVYLVTNNKFYRSFEQWLLKKAFPKKIKIVNDGTLCNEDRLGAIGDIEFAVNHKAIADDLVVIGGDNLLDFDLKVFVEFALKNRPYTTVGLYEFKDKGLLKRYGVVSIDTKGQIVEFQEKPKNPKSNLVSMCLYFFPKENLVLLREYLDAGESKDATGSYIRWLVQNYRVFGCVIKGSWFDIGDVKSYRQADTFVRERRRS